MSVPDDHSLPPASHAGQTLTPREMVRAHAYPVLAAVSTVALVAIATSLGPIAKQAGYQNHCIEQVLAVMPSANAPMNHVVAVKQCTAGGTAQR